MDLFGLIRIEVFVLLPVVLYLLFFKTSGRSLYTGRDYFYPIKYFVAKKVVRAAQEKSRKAREKLRKEPEVVFTSQKDYHYQSFSASDQNGNSLKLKFVLRPSKTAEVILVLKLASGRLYTFPGNENVRVTSVKDFNWKINGLSIETLEPYRRLRVVFNGLLQDISSKDHEKIDHVRFNFIFNCCSAPKFYPEDCDSSLLAESLATRPWTDSSWKHFLDGHPDGYEQFGTLLGVVNLEEEQILNLAACRSRYRGPSDNSELDREVNVFLAETNGVLVYLTLRTLQQEKSQLSYGYVFHKGSVVAPIISQDIRLEDLAPNGNLPDMFMAHINVKTNEYTCVFYLNKSTVVKQTNYQSGCNVFAECNVNKSHGKAVVELLYHHFNKHQQLPAILTEKKVQILPSDLVVNIRSENAQIVNLVGGKGNSLALLSSLQSTDFFIPDGFILTINAFIVQLSQNALLQEALNNIEDAFCGRSSENPQEVCSLAVRLFANEPVHPEVAAQIKNYLSKIKSDTIDDAIDVVSWAVRSSAIGEDSEELSAAGQNETILGCVTDDEVLRAVSKCWGSLFTYQSVQYRWQHGIPIKSEMAVVIQKMVPAEAAGVLFTWHPTTSNPSQMVVTSNFGLGESVVSGKSDPDTFILSRTYRGDVSLTERQIGTKNKVFTLTENGVKEIITSSSKDASLVGNKGQNDTVWSLTEEQVIRLGEVGVSLEEAFGGPRDIEWSFYKGDLYLLQSRPITTLTNWTDFELTHEQDTPVITENSLYTIANTGEVFPTAVSTLCRSASLPLIDRGIQLNLSSDVEPYFLRTTPVFSNRAFLDCIYILYRSARSENIQMATKIMDLAVFGHQVINERIVKMVQDQLDPMTFLDSVKPFYHMWMHSRTVNQIVEKCQQHVKTDGYKINEGDSAEIIYEKLVKSTFLEVPCYSHPVSSQISIFWQIICMVVIVGREKELNQSHYADFANILSSCEDVVSADVPLSLSKIAAIIRDEGYSDEFCAIKPEFGVEWLRTKCPAAYTVFEEFLGKHGHRGLGEFDIINETWGLNPHQVIPMIQANARHMIDYAKVQKSIDEVIRELVSPISLIGRRILRYALKKLRTAVGQREQTKAAFMCAIHQSRLGFRQLAKAMVARGLLPAENLIFHLTLQEIGEILKAPSPIVISKAIRRQKLYPKWNNFKFPELSYGLPQPQNDFEIHAELLPGSKCQGTPVCTGSVQARACVITHLDEIGILEKGDILITFSTDIGWTPYFPMLSGIVTEIGGLVSHGAVVAREYGLPCIVGVKNATKLFKTGDTVFLSGKTGELGKI